MALTYFLPGAVGIVRLLRRSGVIAGLLLAGLYAIACDSGISTGPGDGDPIGSDGGSVSLPGVLLSVPAGSLSPGTEITVRAAAPGDIPAELGVDPGVLVPGTLFDFGPDGLTFSPPATISLTYDPDRLPDGTNESLLRIIRIDTAVSYLTGTRVDTLNKRISAPVDHFTFFAVALPELFPESRDISISETVTVTDEVPTQNTPPISLTVSETVTVTDSLPIESIPPISVSVSETVSIADEVVPPASSVVRIDVAEAIGVSDAPVTVPDQALVRIDVTEAIAVGDAPSSDAPGVVRIDVTESVGVADVAAPSPEGQASADVIESIAVTDAPVVSAPGVVRIAVVESVGVADAPAPLLNEPVAAGVTEAIAVSDVPEVRAISPAALFVGSALAELGLFAPDLSSVGSVAMPGPVGYVAQRPGTNEVWVAERGSDSLVVVNAETNSRVAAEYSGTLDPFAIDFDDAGSIAAVADNDADRIVIFDAATLTQSGLTIRNSGVPRVTGVQLSGDGTTAWVVGNNVAKVDVPGRTPLDTAEVGGITFAADVDLTPDETELWVTDGLSGNIVIYDAVTLAVLDTIVVSAGTTTGGEQLTISDDGATAFATTATSGELVVVDVATRTELNRYAIGGSTSFVAFDPGRAVVLLTSLATDDELIRFDLDTGSVTDRVFFSSPRGLVLFR